jgi:hypothetical protein
LFLEAEVAELEALQNKYDADDLIAANEVVIESHSSWRKFERYATEKDQDGRYTQPSQAAKMELALKIRDKLKEYRMSCSREPRTVIVTDDSSDEALVVHQTLLNSKQPATTTVKAMRNWFLDKNSGNAELRPQLWGSSKTKYDEIHDLVALRVPADQDRISEFILNKFGVFFQNKVYGANLIYIRQKHVTVILLHIRTISREMRRYTQLCSFRNTSLRLYYVALLCSQPLHPAWYLGWLDCAICNLRGMAHQCQARSDICCNGSICCCAGSVCEWNFGRPAKFSCVR